MPSICVVKGRETNERIICLLPEDLQGVLKVFLITKQYNCSIVANHLRQKYNDLVYFYFIFVCIVKCSVICFWLGFQIYFQYNLEFYKLSW